MAIASRTRGSGSRDAMPAPPARAATAGVMVTSGSARRRGDHGDGRVDRRQRPGRQREPERRGDQRRRDQDQRPRDATADQRPDGERRRERADREEQVDPVEHRRAAREQVHAQRVDAGIDDAGPEVHDQEAHEEQRPGRRRGLDQQADRDQGRAGAQQQRAGQPLGERPGRDGARDIQQGAEEVREAHARVALVEGPLHLADERRDEQARPADQQEARERHDDDVAGGVGDRRAAARAAGSRVSGMRTAEPLAPPWMSRWWAILDSNQ